MIATTVFNVMLVSTERGYVPLCAARQTERPRTSPPGAGPLDCGVCYVLEYGIPMLVAAPNPRLNV